MNEHFEQILQEGWYLFFLCSYFSKAIDTTLPISIPAFTICNVKRLALSWLISSDSTAFITSLV